MTQTVNDLEARLAEALKSYPSVLVGYLFGSIAQGAQSTLSDIDVAVLLARDADAHQAQLELIEVLGRLAAPLRADVLILNDAPVPVAYRALRDGRVIFCRNDIARIRHWTATVDRYIDMEPMRRALAEGTRHRLEEDRFGRP